MPNGRWSLFFYPENDLCEDVNRRTIEIPLRTRTLQLTTA